MAIFASSVPAYDSGHWIEWVALFSAFIFALITIILILSITFSKKQKFISGPFYLRKAPDILKWIAISVPIFTTFSFLIGFYDSVIYLSYQLEEEVSYDIFTWTEVIGELIIGITIGLGVSLLCLIGLAVHFFRTLEPAEPANNE